MSLQMRQVLSLRRYRLRSEHSRLTVRYYYRSSGMADTETREAAYKTQLEQSVSTSSNIEAGQRSGRSNKQGGRGGPPRKRDTHFLCFPLVTDASIPQLSKSLRHFRDVATKPSRSQQDQAKVEHENEDYESGAGQEERAESHGSTGRDPRQLQPNMNRSQPVQLAVEGLNLLPASTHRPPGTFHLTLGVMDLSEPDEMDRALTLLQELDYAELLQGVLQQRADIRLPIERDLYQDLSAHSRDPDLSTEQETELSSLTRSVSPPQTSQRPGFTVSSLNKEQPPTISLTGLSTFPSAKSSRVFYAKPSPSTSSPFPLLPFGQAIRRKFREAGFITETRPLVLHATVANMRYAVQAKGGRTSKGKAWRYGKDRWNDGQVDARELIRCFDQYGGDAQSYVQGKLSTDEPGKEFIWASDISLDRVAICKMGAEKSEDEVLGQVYPPVGEKRLFQ